MFRHICREQRQRTETDSLTSDNMAREVTDDALLAVKMRRAERLEQRAMFDVAASIAALRQLLTVMQHRSVDKFVFAWLVLSK